MVTITFTLDTSWFSCSSYPGSTEVHFERSHTAAMRRRPLGGHRTASRPPVRLWSSVSFDSKYLKMPRSRSRERGRRQSRSESRSTSSRSSRSRSASSSSRSRSFSSSASSTSRSSRASSRGQNKKPANDRSRSPDQRKRRSRSHSRSRSPSRGRRRTTSRSRSPSHQRSRSPSPRVNERRRSPSPAKITRVHVGKLTRNVNKEHVQEIFSAYGTIKLVDMPMDRVHPSISRGFAYVEFSTSDEASKAIKYMDGGQIDGQEITVSQVLIQNRNRERFQPQAPRGNFRGNPNWRRSPPRRVGRRSPPRYRRSPPRGRSRTRSRSRSPRRDRRAPSSSGSSR